MKPLNAKLISAVQPDHLYPVPDVANVCGKTQATIRRWLRVGIIPYHTDAISGHYLVLGADLRTLLGGLILKSVPAAMETDAERERRGRAAMADCERLAGMK